MTSPFAEQLKSIYAVFNARDIDGVLAATTDDVDWPNAWEGGRLHGHEELRSYWTRQWAAIDPHVEPTTITSRPDGRIAVSVHQVVRSLEGELLSEKRRHPRVRDARWAHRSHGRRGVELSVVNIGGWARPRY